MSPEEFSHSLINALLPFVPYYVGLLILAAILLLFIGILSVLGRWLRNRIGDYFYW